MAEPTPGQCAYEAYWHAHYTLRNPTHRHVLIGWKKVMPTTKQCWEAAAQAVCLETCQRALAVVRHWHEFGPEYDFAETITSLERWLQAQPPQEDPHA